MNDLNQSGPHKDLPLGSGPFCRLIKNPTSEKNEVVNPAQKGMNPGPGDPKVPCPYRKESKAIRMPAPKRDIEAC